MSIRKPVKYGKTRPLHRLRKRPKRRKAVPVATLPLLLEPAHLVVHGLHRAERTAERLARNIGRAFPSIGPGLVILVGERVELEDLDLPDNYLADLEEQVHSIMEDTGSTIASEAADIAPVDTGLLRESVFYNVEEAPLALIVGDTAPYAGFVEHGTAKMPPRPYLSLAIAGNEAEMELEIDAAVNETLDSAAQDEDAGLIPLDVQSVDLEIETVIEQVAIEDVAMGL